MAAKATQVATGSLSRLTLPSAKRRGAGPSDVEGVVASELRHSRMFLLAVEVYRAHARDGAGRCRSCGVGQCRSRVHAATIIDAAGASPAAFELSTHRPPRRRGLLARRVAITTGGGERRPAPAPDGGRWTRRPAMPRDVPHRRPSAVWRPGLGMGSSVTAFVPPLDSYLLRGLLYCVCGQPFFPLGSTNADRSYRSLCGCRLWPLEANDIECRARAEAELVDGMPAMNGRTAELARLFVRIEVGGTADMVRFQRRT